MGCMGYSLVLSRSVQRSTAQHSISLLNLLREQQVATGSVIRNELFGAVVQSAVAATEPEAAGGWQPQNDRHHGSRNQRQHRHGVAAALVT